MYYIGQTNDVHNRFARHNAGYEKFTSKFRPWQMIWFCEKPDRAKAMALERKLKNLSKARLRAFIEKYK